MNPAIATVPFNDLALQWQQIRGEVELEMQDLFAQSAFCLGSYVDRFENEVAQYLGARHAIGVNSGTSALHIALLAAGIGPGAEVLVPAHTFVATVWAVLYVGATPVLCDVDPVTGCIDAEDAAQRISDHTRAIIPVHLYGQPADMKAIGDLAGRHGLSVIEDSAQAIGATFDGASVGTIGLAGCFSFYPGKNLGAAGEAGLVVTADDALADRMRSLRNHAQSERYIHNELGFNYRMDGIQGLVLSQKLRLLDNWTQDRREMAARYAKMLSGLPLGLPQTVNGNHVWHLYVVRTPRRDALMKFLAGHGVASGLHYPVPLHRQPFFSGMAPQDAFPNSDAWAKECLSLPLYTGMTADQQHRVVEVVRAFFNGGGPAS